ncbi:MAG: DUF2254 domain-containing protein [Magnetospiraceae bacterium]
MSKWQWVLLQISRLLWVRAAIIGALGIGAAVLAALTEAYQPGNLNFTIGADAVDSLLSIIASSMLAVTTFSLSVMTSAFGAAANNVTPRATKLLVQDRLTQNVLSTFLGSFLFSIVGLVVLKARAYGPEGRAVLFLFTIFVIALIVVSLLRWIDHLTRLGRVGETTDRVEQATRDAITQRLEKPFLGGCARTEEKQHPESAIAIAAHSTGYVQNIDLVELSACAKDVGATVFLEVIPGAFVFLKAPLAWIDLPQEEGHKVARAKLLEVAQRAITIGEERNFDQDPRFGFCVLSEIASRALSPAINDSGTAIDVIGRATRLLLLWSEGSVEVNEANPPYPDIHVPTLKIDDIFEDAFGTLARDGAAQVEVQLRLRKSLKALSQVGGADFRNAAHRQAALALKRAESALPLEEDTERLRAVSFER